MSVVVPFSIYVSCIPLNIIFWYSSLSLYVFPSLTHHHYLILLFIGQLCYVFPAACDPLLPLRPLHCQHHFCSVLCWHDARWNCVRLVSTDMHVHNTRFPFLFKFPYHMELNTRKTHMLCKKQASYNMYIYLHACSFHHLSVWLLTSILFSFFLSGFLIFMVEEEHASSLLSWVRETRETKLDNDESLQCFNRPTQGNKWYWSAHLFRFSPSSLFLISQLFLFHPFFFLF